MNSPRFRKITSKLLALCVAAVIAAAIMPFAGIEAIIPAAKADTLTYTVNTGDVGAVNSALAAYSNGDIINMVLTQDIVIPLGTPLTVPSGLTVNLYMNTFRIIYNHPSSGDGAEWQIGELSAIVNNGTLNIYSGGSATSSSLASSSTSASCIYVANIRGDMTSKNGEIAYVYIAAVKNSGTLTVNKNVSIYVANRLEYNQGQNSMYLLACGIFNTANNIDCTINAAAIDAYTYCHPYASTSSSDASYSAEYSYGVYGGNITVNGNTKINVEGRGFISRSGLPTRDPKGYGHSVAFDICSAGQIEVNGGIFAYSATCDGNKDVVDDGTGYSTSGGIAYSGNSPLITDGTISTAGCNLSSSGDANTQSYVHSDFGTEIFFESTVVRFNTLPASPASMFGYATYSATLFVPPVPYTDGTVCATYRDESNNIYNPPYSNTNKSHPLSLVRGAVEGTYRVHVVYRYWADSNRSTPDTSVGGNGLGYSYVPMTDGTEIVEAPISFTVAGGGEYTNGVRTNSATTLKYKMNAQPKNSYYWQLSHLASLTTSTPFSDVKVTATTNRGTTMKTFLSSTTDIAVGSGVQAPLYIFVDYIRVIPSDLRITAGANNTVSVPYIGAALIPGTDFSVNIADFNTGVSYTGDYDIDKDGVGGLTNVSYSYTGSSSGEGLPTNAGTYTLTISVAQDTTYSADASISKNRNACTQNVALTITKADALRGTLPASVSFTYGTTIADCLSSLSGYTANGVGNDSTLTGAFSYANPSDAVSYKAYGSSNISMVWTPSGAASSNYQTTTFQLAYTVNKASLVIKANPAAVVYGENNFTTPYSLNCEGLVGNDNNTESIGKIKAAMSFFLSANGTAYNMNYSAGTTQVGSYYIKPQLTSVPDVLANYNYTVLAGAANNPDGILTVSRRALTVTADSVSRAYAPDSFTVGVHYTINSGIIGADQVVLMNGTGDLAVTGNTVGIQTVYNISASSVSAALTGTAAGNYYVGTLIYTSGASFTVEITKATPAITIPTVTSVFYRYNRTLADINLNAGYTPEIAGTWSWANSSQNPTVSVTSYAAVFTPTDVANYNVINYNIPITVKQTDVTITYNATVTYGDVVPNITNYQYSAPNDSSFNIANVVTAGNISASTTYTSTSGAGSYPVTLAASNYRDSAGNYKLIVVSGTISVNPKTITITANNVRITYGDSFIAENICSYTYSNDLVGTDTINSITYNGNAPVFNYGTNYDTADAAHRGAGNYSIVPTYSFTASNNYNIVLENGNLNVGKATLTITGATLTNVYYGDAVPSLASAYVLSGCKYTDSTLADCVTSGAVQFTTGYYQGASVTAAGYPINIGVTEVVCANYDIVTVTGKIMLKKATPAIGGTVAASVTYGDNLGTAVFSSVTVSVSGTFRFDAASVTPAYNASVQTTYSASFVPNDTTNYNTITAIYPQLTVNLRPISGILTLSGIPMVGEILTADLSNLAPSTAGYYTYQWYSNDIAITGANASSYTVRAADEGKTVRLIVTVATPYTGTAAYTTTNIAPMLTAITTGNVASLFSISGMQTVIYNATPYSVTVTNAAPANTVLGAVTVKYNGSTQYPTNVGTYLITIDVATPNGAYLTDITQNGGVTYDNVNGMYVYAPVVNLTIGTLTIQPKTYTVNVTIGDKAYDGAVTATPSEINESGICIVNTVPDDVYFDAAAAVFNFPQSSVGMNLNVSAANTKLAGSDASNYTLVVNIMNTASINQRVLDVTLIPVSRPYQAGNTQIELNFDVDVNDYAPTDSAAHVYPDIVSSYALIGDSHAGMQNVTSIVASLAGSRASNYKMNILNGEGLKVVIEKATPDYPLPDVDDLIYYDSGRTLSQISLGDSRWVWINGSVIPTAGKATFTARFTPTDTANYAVIELPVEIEISKAVLTVSPASFNITYGADAPTYYFTVSGFTGADNYSSVCNGYVLLNCGYNNGDSIGKYQITVTSYLTADNYTFAYPNSYLTVTPAPVYVTATAADRTYTPDNTNVSVSFSELSGVLSSDTAYVYLNVSSAAGTIANANAGTKFVTYTQPTLQGSKSGNYELVVINPSGELTVNINPAGLVGLVMPTTATVAFGDYLRNATITSTYSGDGSFSFVDGNQLVLEYSPSAVNDVYQIKFVPNDSNYATIIQYISVTVNKASLNVTMSISGTAKRDETLLLVISGLSDEAARYVTFTWYRLDNPDNAAVNFANGTPIGTGTSYTVTGADEGFYIGVQATVSLLAPYNCTGSTVAQSVVQGESLTLWQKIWNWLYKIISNITQIFANIGG